MFLRLLLASALAVGLASAQRGGGSGGGGGGGDMGSDMGGGGAGGGGGMPRAVRQSKADIVIDKLHLNKDQKAQALTIFAAAQEAAGPINEQLRQGRNVITSAILDGKTGDDLNKMLAQFTDLLAQKTAVEATAYGKLYAILDPKQQAKASLFFADQMDGMFDGGGGRARGARGGGGQR